MVAVLSLIAFSTHDKLDALVACCFGYVLLWLCAAHLGRGVLWHGVALLVLVVVMAPSTQTPSASGQEQPQEQEPQKKSARP